MDLTKLLKGRKVKIMTNVKVEVELEIESVNESKHSRDLEPATAKNDCWHKPFKINFANKDNIKQWLKLRADKISYINSDNLTIDLLGTD